MSFYPRLFTSKPPEFSSPRPPKSESPNEEMIRKRTSWNGLPLRPDPFRFGHPNPLGCHPVFNGKHPDYISGKGKGVAPVSGLELPRVEVSAPAHLELCTHGEDLTIRSLDNPLSRPIRVDNLVAVQTPIPEDRISSSLPTIPEEETASIQDDSKSFRSRFGVDKIFKRQPSVLKLNDKPSSVDRIFKRQPSVPKLNHKTSLVDRVFKRQPSVPKLNDEIKHTQVTPEPSKASRLQEAVYTNLDCGDSLRNFMNYQEATVAEGANDREAVQLQNLPIPLKQETSSSKLKRLQNSITGIDYDAPIKHSVVSGLPRGWTHNHDRLIAYLDTHAKLDAGWIPENEQECERYNVGEMVVMLHKKFEIFKNVFISHDAISTRLQILELQDVTYFNMPYFSYENLSWGRDI